MSVELLKSAAITNRDATPTVLTNSNTARGQLHTAAGLCTPSATASIASIFRHVEVPSNARVQAVLLTCGAVTSAAGDIGVYRNTRDGGAVVDADFFASAQSLASILTNSDVTNESTVHTPAQQLQPLWQALGLTSDPNTTFDIATTLTAAATASADVVLKVQFAE
jgi:hypothetical protein